MKPLLAALVSLVTLVVTGCTSGSSPEANPSAAPSAEGVSPSPAIAIDDLQGKILFTRAGGTYGDETVFTADADGTNERRITGSV
jgi:hypothetical protein